MFGDALLRRETRLDHPDEVAARVRRVPTPRREHARVEGELALGAQSKVKLVVFEARTLVPAVTFERRAPVDDRGTHRRESFFEEHRAHVAVSVAGPVERAVNDLARLAYDEGVAAC